MRTRFLSAAVAVAVACAFPMAANAQPIEPQAAKKKLVTKVFSVADLVVPIPDFVATGPGEKAAIAEQWKKPTTAEAGTELVRQITTMVRPHTWESMGGVGKIEFHERGMALVVTQTPDVVADVADHLEALRKLQDVNVAVAVRYLKVPVGSAARLGLKQEGNAPLTFDDKSLAKMLTEVQANEASSIMQTPKVTLFNGQVGTIACGERRSFATGMEATLVNGKAVLITKNTTIDLGDMITICGRISADGQFVKLRVNAKRTRLAGEKVEMVPVTWIVMPVFEGGLDGKLIPFTQFLEAPKVKTNTVQKTVTIPSGRTVVVGTWTEPGSTPVAVPGLSELPLIGELFKTSVPTEMEVVVLATVNVIRTVEPAK